MEISWKCRGTAPIEVKKNHGVTYLSYRRLEQEEKIVHGFSTRLGGVSQGYLGSMNLSFSRGDDPEAVRENYKRISEAIGFSAESIVASDQTHTTNVRRVGRTERGCGWTKPKPYTDVDGLITDEPGVTLTTFYADCVPLYLYDPEHTAIGLSHSGWRGTVGNIAKGTVEAMEKAYGTDPEQLICAIGPSICQDCYEVSEDVIEEFRKQYRESIHETLFYQKENGKYQLNLWEACKENFLQAGVPMKNIILPQLCTCCNPEFLFSHRASAGKRGNLAAFLGIREV